MAIWRKKPITTPAATECTEETKTTTYSFLTSSQEEQEKTYEEEVSLKKPSVKIPDLNETINCEEVVAIAPVVLPTKRRSSVMRMEYYQTLEEKINEMNKSMGTTWCEASLVLKGCKGCHIYVMVSEVDERCPKCSLGTFLCDVSHPNKQRRLF